MRDVYIQTLVHNITIKTNIHNKLLILIIILIRFRKILFKALYPSIIGENNLAPNTQTGKIIIPGRIYINENIYMNDKYSRSGEFIENLCTDNIIEFANRWFHLGGIKDVIYDIDELCTHHNITPYSQVVGTGVLGNLVLFKDNNMVTTPIVFSNSDRYTRPFVIYQNKDPEITYEKLFEGNKNR